MSTAVTAFIARAAAIAAMTGVVACDQAPEATFELERNYVEGALISPMTPAATFEIDQRFAYLGGFAFPLKGLARVERHVWAVIDDQNISRLIVIQFEAALEGQDFIYRFGIPPTDQRSGGNFLFSPERVKIGDHGYVQNSWAFDLAASAQNDEQAESARQLEFLASKSLDIENELIMSRMVRAVGPSSRAEIILFYIEPLSAHGYSLEDFPEDGPLSPEFSALSDLVLSRQLESMRIMEHARN